LAIKTFNHIFCDCLWSTTFARFAIHWRIRFRIRTYIVVLFSAPGSGFLVGVKGQLLELINLTN
jgi:hypothetical protein